ENPISEVKAHPQSDGGAILEAIIADVQGRISKQEFQVPISARKRFGDTFLIDDFKASVRTGTTPRFSQPSSLEIATTDPLFLEDLEEAHIEGVRVSRRIHASADTNTVHKALFSVEFDGVNAVRSFEQWLDDRVIKKTSYKIIVNDIDVSNNTEKIRS